MSRTKDAWLEQTERDMHLDVLYAEDVAAREAERPLEDPQDGSEEER